MSKVSEIREICGDYAFEVEYSENNKFTMFFNSRRNAETVKRCIEIDDSVPNAATAVDFVEVVRCKDCKHCEQSYPHKEKGKEPKFEYTCCVFGNVNPNFYCGIGERKEK